MFKGDRNFAVGLFVSVAIAVLVAFVLWLTGRSGNEDLTRYSLLFHRDVSGLAMGAPVKYMGVDIGSVVSMQLERNQGMRVRVDIDVLSSTPVDQGTYASIALQGITGVAVINLASEPGRHGPLETLPGQDYPVIPVKDVGLSAVLSSAPEIMNKLDSLLAKAGALLGEDNQQSVNASLENVREITAALAGDRESLAALPRDLNATLAEIQATAADLRTMLAQTQPNLQATLVNLNHSSENLAALTDSINEMLSRHDADIEQFMRDGLGQAPELVQDARQSLRELEKLVAELRRDPSQLISAPGPEGVKIDP
ncbi:MAG: MlaD family protein [Lysobacterales bacterium]|jgi:phospholipid/cholesterol/gamma-HCH transport system substrate-binding protein